MTNQQTGTTERDLQSLRCDWQAAFGSPPDKYLSPRFMTKALAWHWQCEASGGFPARLGKRLRDLGARPNHRNAELPRIPTPGSLLAREWNGRMYHVEVTPEGFRFDGAVYRSLTPIARRITGTNWSGPRFFGLKMRGGAG